MFHRVYETSHGQQTVARNPSQHLAEPCGLRTMSTHSRLVAPTRIVGAGYNIFDQANRARCFNDVESAIPIRQPRVWGD